MSGHAHEGPGEMWLDVYRRFSERLAVPTPDPRARPHPLLRLRSWRSRGRGIGWCYRCRHTWHVVTPHPTMYNDFEGCFPLCEGCWQALTPDERLPFYDQMLEGWAANSATSNGVPWDVVRSTMHEAVLAGG